MSIAVSGRYAAIAATTATDRALGMIVAAGLLIAAATHIELALSHGLSIFAGLAFAAGCAQALLAVVAVLRPSTVALRATVLLSLVLIQLYALNVTTGLPPVIAHSHVPGTHSLLGLTLADPNTVDPQGVIAQICQLVAAASGGLLQSRSGATVRAV